MDLLRHFEKEQVQAYDRPKLRAGDIVRVEMKITEGDNSRLQTFEGTVLGIRGSGPSTTFTVRRETGSFGVERIFPLYSPLISTIDIVKRQKVRRARLHYLRQSGRRRYKEDVLSMQRLVKEEDDKKRLAEEAQKKADEEAQKTAAEEAKAKDKEAAAKKSEEEAMQKEEAVSDESPEAGTSDESPDTSDEADAGGEAVSDSPEAAADASPSDKSEETTDTSTDKK